jgi:protein arginine kinase activator
MIHCDSCQSEEASVFLTEIVNGKMQKVNLCPACAKAKGVNDPTGFQLTDLLLGLGAAKEVEGSAGLLKCPVCGFTATDLKKTGRLGCSNCYEVFAAQLGPMLKNMHKGTTHLGRVPQRYAQERELAEKLQALENTLQQAVESEEYERAASIRDQIRQLAPPPALS